MFDLNSNICLSSTMPNYCSAFNCTSSGDLNPEVMFHGFPSEEKEKDRFSKWLNAVKRKDFFPSRHSKICSLHFTSEDYNPPVVCGKPRLKKSAVPSIFHFSEYLFPNHCPKRRIIQKEPEIHTSELTADVPVQFDEPTDRFDIIKGAQKSVTTCDISTQTTLTGVILKQKILQYQKEKQVLQRKVGRQNKRISNLKHMLKLLKDNGRCNDLHNSVNSSHHDLLLTHLKFVSCSSVQNI